MKGSRAHTFSLIAFSNPEERASDPPVPGLAYTKAFYGNLLDWYKDVQSRAQLALTLDGAFVTILSGVVFSKSDDLENAIKVFGIDTWVFLVLTGVSFLLSIMFAVAQSSRWGYARAI
jgi:hypothetical protein